MLGRVIMVLICSSVRSVWIQFLVLAIEPNKNSRNKNVTSLQNGQAIRFHRQFPQRVAWCSKVVRKGVRAPSLVTASLDANRALRFLSLRLTKNGDTLHSLPTNFRFINGSKPRTGKCRND